MQVKSRFAWVLLSAAIAGSCFAADGPSVGAHSPSQAVADLVRTAAGTDLAFMAAELVKTDYQKDKPETILSYPTEEIVVVNLTGTQIRKALERSLSLYPQPNNSFLQLSGMEVTFSKSASTGSRVLSVTVDGAKLQDTKSYTVAMPTSLGRGGLGYFKIWDKTNIARTVAKQTMESVVKGKTLGESSPRWVAQP